MKQYHFLTSIFCFAIFVIGTEAIKAEQTAKYHKAGDVGVFSVGVEIRTSVNIDTTVFTARASNEKAYLLYVQAPQSVAQRLTNVMQSQRYVSPEQEEIQKQMSELYEKNARTSENLREARSKLKALKSISEDAKKENDRVLFEKTQLKINELEPKIAELEVLNKELNEQIQEIHEKRRKVRKKGPGRRPQDPVSTSLKVLGRFRESGNVKIEVYARDSAELLAKVNLIASLELHLPPTDTENPELLKEWLCLGG